MIIWLASFPRSGNTFFRIILEKLYGQESLSLYGDDPAHVSSELEAGPNEAALERLQASPKLHFIKTHELPSDDSPAILIVRDGRDAMVSFAHYIEDYGVVRRSPFGEFVANLDACRQELLHGRPRFDQLLRRIVERRYFDWSGHYRAWSARPSNCAVVKFESLIRQPEIISQGALQALGLGLTRLRGDKLPTFDQLHEQDPKFFRAGQVGQWQAEMSPDVEELFWREHLEGMRQAGYRS